MLYTEPLSSMPVYMTLCGNFLLVYTTENIMNIYNVMMSNNNNSNSNSNNMINRQLNFARLEPVRRISLDGIVTRISKVRSISLFHISHGGNQDHDLDTDFVLTHVEKNTSDLLIASFHQILLCLLEENCSYFRQM